MTMLVEIVSRGESWSSPFGLFAAGAVGARVHIGFPWGSLLVRTKAPFGYHTLILQSYCKLFLAFANPIRGRGVCGTDGRGRVVREVKIPTYGG